MTRLLLMLLSMLALCTGVCAQVKLQVGSQNVEVEDAGIQYIFTDRAVFSSTFANSLLPAGWLPYSNAVRISYQPKVLWLKIPLARLATIDTFSMVVVDNPNLNALRCWIIRDGALKDSFPLTGDHQAFDSRPEPVNDYVFPLQKADYFNDTLLLAVEKRSSKMEVPLSFRMQSDFLESLQRSYLWYGVIGGLLLLLIFFNLFLFVSAGENVYAWYGLYLAGVLVYLAANAGLLFQFVWPRQPEFNDLTRPFAFALSLFPLLFFFNALLQIRHHAPGMYRVNKIILIIFAFICLAALVTSISGNHIVQGFWLRVNAATAPVILVIVLAESVLMVKRKVRLAWFALLSFSTFTILITIYALGNNGLIAETYFVRHAHYLGIALDCFIVGCSLVWRYYSFRKEAVKMQTEYLEQQRRIFTESAEWQKHELERFSSLLHDNVGAHLGFLRLKVDKMPLDEAGRKEVAAMVTELGNEVRHMSHQFSPLQLQHKGLSAALEEMVQRMDADSGIAVQYEWIGSTRPLDLQYELLVYRILQELFQNLIKHSGATEAILQIMREEGLFGIYLEDNGRGTDKLDEAGKGIGLRSIEQLTKLLKGSFSIKTAEGKGFSISVEFPLIQ